MSAGFFRRVRNAVIPESRRRSRRSSVARMGDQRSRKLQLEMLEVRRLLVSEGDLFSIDRTIDATGIAGKISAVIDWGDGTTTPATVQDNRAEGNLRFRFDYSFDTRGFFSGANRWRRDLLELSGQMLLGQITDQLTAIKPTKTNTWQGVIWHPSQGSPSSVVEQRLPKSLRVEKNEIVVYVGSRNLPGEVRAVAGIGGILEARGSDYFLRTIQARGESGALKKEPTDFGPSHGFVSFDSENSTSWYFGRNPNNIGKNQLDFISVATHELAHILGFGVAPSWNQKSNDRLFWGNNAKRADEGSGSIRLEDGHWAEGVTSKQGGVPLMHGHISAGERRYLTPLDLAALDDIGWKVGNTNVRISNSHVYADNGNFPVRIILRGHKNGKLVGERIIDLGKTEIDNVDPSLKVPANMTVRAGETFTIKDIGQLTDPGFDRNKNGVESSETFRYRVDWGDGSEPDDGPIKIKSNGKRDGTPTIASFDASHRYSTPGTKTVKVYVADDDGGERLKTFKITVKGAVQLNLASSRTTVNEDDGEGAAILTISRSGDAIDQPQRIQLESSDRSELRVPERVTIPANRSWAKVPLDAVDDALLDGFQEVTLTASGAGVQAGTIDVLVKDHEVLSAKFSKSVFSESREFGTNLTVQRSNENTKQPLIVNIKSNKPGEVNTPKTVTIPAGNKSATVKVTPIDDQDPELQERIAFEFTAAGYESASAFFELQDDEPPEFQNPVDPFDVNNRDGVRASDAIRIINELARRKSARLNPDAEQPKGVYLDVNGDYLVTALDALIVINELPNRDQKGEQILDGQQTVADDEEFSEAMTQLDVMPPSTGLF